MVAVLVVALVACAVWAWVDLTGPINEAPFDAAAEPGTPPRTPRRAHPTPGEHLLCTVNGHTTTDWATHYGRPICTRCDQLLPQPNDLPYDQEADQLVAETEAFLRGAS